jgi:hypothetical protein
MPNNQAHLYQYTPYTGMEDVLGIASPLTQYEPYNGMEGHQLGQQGFDPKYHEDPLMQELMKARAFDQILGAFTPQIAQGGGSNAFLDTLLGETAQDAAPVAAQAAAPAAPAPVEAAPMTAPEGRNDGYDAPGGFAGPDGYGLYSNHYAGTGMYNAPNESVTGFYSGQNSEGSKGEGGAAGK